MSIATPAVVDVTTPRRSRPKANAARKQQRRPSLVARDGNYCHYCGKSPEQAKRKILTEDHIIPRILGGPNALWNIVLACMSCGQKKGVSLPSCSCPVCVHALVMFAALLELGLVAP